MRVQLISPAPNVGAGANDGAYYPCGLLTLASALVQCGHSAEVYDECHGPVQIDPLADVVGLQVPSTLCHKGALTLAEQAKALGRTVVLGGPHASSLAEQILSNRPAVDFVVRGKGERPIVELIRALQGEIGLESVPSLTWRRDGQIRSNAEDCTPWSYDPFTPLPLEFLQSGIHRYWNIFRQRINPNVDAAFVVFTHFACEYRRTKMAGATGPENLVLSDGRTRYCSFCSLQDITGPRRPQSILHEIRHYLNVTGMERGARIMLKCYGDNIGPYSTFVHEFADAVEETPWWKDYDFRWTFYCQSSKVTDSLLHDLKRIGTECLFIGFDSADDRIQRLNGLGTNMKTHLKAVDLCEKWDIRIQGASVVGQIGETPESLENDYQFFASLLRRGVLERINSAILFVIPGSACYQLLLEREPWLREHDLLSTNEVRDLWIKHFCPAVSRELLEEYAAKISALSPGPRARMGYNGTQ